MKRGWRSAAPHLAVLLVVGLLWVRVEWINSDNRARDAKRLELQLQQLDRLTGLLDTAVSLKRIEAKLDGTTSDSLAR